MDLQASTPETIPVNQPVVPEEAKRLVMGSLEAGWLSSAGPMVAEFESAFADRIGARYAVATPSGTAALHLSLSALDLGPDDEVIVPDFTMFATVAAVLYCGARPVCVDVDPETYTIDPAAVRAALTPKTRAIVAVHIYGHSADMEPLRAIAEEHRLALVEDAAEAHGARYRGQNCGTLGDLAAFSFYGNKIISTGEGGMLVTSDALLAEKARSLGDMAHRPGARFSHDQLGYSYRMGSLQAALGLGQLAHLDEFLARKRWMAASYAERLGRFSGLHLPITRPWAENVHWMYAVRVTENFPLTRNELGSALKQRGIDTRDFFKPCSSQSALTDRYGPQRECAVSKRIAETGLYLPSGLALTAEQLGRVCDEIERLACR